jgi:xylulokinase
MDFVLGIDIGTSGCKLVLLDEKGSHLLTKSQELFPITKVDGTVEQNPKEWYLAMASCLKAMERDNHIDLHRICAIGVTGQMQGITLLDKDNEPVRNSILWNDIRCEKEMTVLKEKHQAYIEGITGYPITTGLSVSKIHWLKNHEPENWEKTSKFLFASNYISFKLTGVLNTDENNICQSGLSDIRKNTWSEELLELCEVGKDKLLPVFGCFDLVGGVTERSAAETGLKQGTPVIAGGGDAGAESYSISLADEERMKIRLGTAADLNVVYNVSKVINDEWHGFRDVVKDFVLFSAITKSCAFSVKWARSVFYSEQPAAPETYDLMDREADIIPLGSEGLIYYPYLYGEAAPYYNPGLTAKFIGMRGGITRGHFVRAVYEGVAFAIKDVIRCTTQFKDIKQFVFVGGGTKSRLWISILADVLGHDALLPRNCDAAYGAALMAGDGVKLWDGKKIASNNMLDCTTVKSIPQNFERYNGIFEKYLQYAGK